MKSFIETNFPVSYISKECLKERKAGGGQTLTSLGKWWGRKPLILIRAIILGLLMPASNDPKKDLEIFLKILTMDNSGLKLRKNKSIDIKDIINHLSPSEKNKYIDFSTSKPKFKKGISNIEKENIENIIFEKLSYDEKLKYCCRPEETEITDINEWKIINKHLNTNAYSLSELIRQLSLKHFNREIIIGDCFCGGGSIPFEASRLGLKTYSSDLNPIAVLLTLASLKILGNTKAEVNNLKNFQQKILNEVDKIITDLKIEYNELNHRANTYIYCLETKCPECNYLIPLAPSWIISKKTNTIAILTKNDQSLNYDIDIKSNVSNEELEIADKNGTFEKSYLKCPNCKNNTKISTIRKDYKSNDGKIIYGLRPWEKHEFMPRPDDIFQERLYCIRYENENGNYYYTKPTDKDLEREKKVIEILSEKFIKWQEQGYIPNDIIEEGKVTLNLLRTRGFTHWHHLFNPRQLLINGLIMEIIDKFANTINEKIIGTLMINKICNNSSRLTFFDNAMEKPSLHYVHFFMTKYNFCALSVKALMEAALIDLDAHYCNINDAVCIISDARNINYKCDIWINDILNYIDYEELTEEFIAWDKKFLCDILNIKNIDSRRALAIKSENSDYYFEILKVFQRLHDNMADDGKCVIMIPNNNIELLKNIIIASWISKFKTDAIWSVITEIENNETKIGDFMQGVTLLVLSKQFDKKSIYLDELSYKITNNLNQALKEMIINAKESIDYIMLVYTIVIRTLTSYTIIDDNINIYDNNINKEILTQMIDKLINDAFKNIHPYLVPNNFNKTIWNNLSEIEKFYIKCLEFENNFQDKLFNFQEIAKVFHILDYKHFLEITKDFTKVKLLKDTIKITNIDEFNNSLLKDILIALHKTIENDDTICGSTYLKDKLKENFWAKKNVITAVLDYIGNLNCDSSMPDWKNEVKYAQLLSEYIKNVEQ